MSEKIRRKRRVSKDAQDFTVQLVAHVPIRLNVKAESVGDAIDRAIELLVKQKRKLRTPNVRDFSRKEAIVWKNDLGKKGKTAIPPVLKKDWNEIFYAKQNGRVVYRREVPWAGVLARREMAENQQLGDRPDRGLPQFDREIYPEDLFAGLGKKPRGRNPGMAKHSQGFGD